VRKVDAGARCVNVSKVGSPTARDVSSGSRRLADNDQGATTGARPAAHRSSANTRVQHKLYRRGPRHRPIPQELCPARTHWTAFCICLSGTPDGCAPMRHISRMTREDPSPIAFNKIADRLKEIET